MQSSLSLSGRGPYKFSRDFHPAFYLSCSCAQRHDLSSGGSLPEDLSMAPGSLADNTTHLSLTLKLSGSNTVDSRSVLVCNFTPSLFTSGTDVFWFLSSLVHFQPSLAFSTVEDLDTLLAPQSGAQVWKLYLP